jgi:hypothetical protein
MTKHVTVFGVSHRLQGAENYPNNVEDPHYALLIARLLQGKDFIFEEASGRGPTFAQKVAIERFGLGKYSDLDPALDTRHLYGIGVTGRAEPIDPTRSPEVIAYEYDLEHEKREALWLKRIGEQHFTAALFVCGYLHVLSMAFRLRVAGCQVEACYYMPHEKLGEKGAGPGAEARAQMNQC